MWVKLSLLILPSVSNPPLSCWNEYPLLIENLTAAFTDILKYTLPEGAVFVISLT